jgi:hypothetical protein
MLVPAVGIVAQVIVKAQSLTVDCWASLFAMASAMINGIYIQPQPMCVHTIRQDYRPKWVQCLSSKEVWFRTGCGICSNDACVNRMKCAYERAEQIVELKDIWFRNAEMCAIIYQWRENAKNQKCASSHRDPEFRELEGPAEYADEWMADPAGLLHAESTASEDADAETDTDSDIDKMIAWTREDENELLQNVEDERMHNMEQKMRKISGCFDMHPLMLAAMVEIGSRDEDGK